MTRYFLGNEIDPIGEEISGRIFWFRPSASVAERVMTEPDLVVKGSGGYVLIPPSVHPSGARYVAFNPGAEIIRVSHLADVIPNPPAERVSVDPIPPLTRVASMSSLWPTSTIDEIKSRISILDYFPGAKPSGGNRWFITRCPFHDDKSPSLRIDSIRGIAFCWSGCTGDKGLDIFGIHAKFHNLTNKEAVRELAAKVSA